MGIPEYEYSVEECDVPEVRRGSLRAYRAFRRKCLEYLRGDVDTSVMNQIHGLAWHTAVFGSLNEARRIEQDRSINGALWELATAGYVSLMALGIRKLVDRDDRVDSLWNVLEQVERHPEMLTREKFVCYDGLPYDYQSVYQDHVSSMVVNDVVRSLPTKGPQAWAVSEMLHKAFDQLSGAKPEMRKRVDRINLTLVSTLKDALRNPAIKKVCTIADKRIAHAERFSKTSKPIPTATYSDINQSFKQVVRVASFLSSSFFYDAAIGSVMPTPQFDVFKSLGQPWVMTDNIPALSGYWSELSRTMDEWADSAADEFLSGK